MNELTMTYEEAKNILREKLDNMKMSFIAAGYYMKYIRDHEQFREDGYESIWEFAEDNYGIKKSTASRWMSMNDKFSQGGNSPILAEEYRGFEKSQLQEMLYLDDKQMEMVTPDMTVKEVALQLAAQGKTTAEIAKETGWAYNTVYYYLNPDKCKPKKQTDIIPVDYKNPDARPGWNADRKKCKTCRYRQAHNNPTDLNKGNCNYIEIAGHSRGCAVEDCDRYVKGIIMKKERKWIDR